MANIISKHETLELKDGNTVELTLNFEKLLWLKAHNFKEEVAAAMAAINGKELDFLEMPYLFYAAYLCALPTTEEPAYTQAEFIKQMPFNMGRVSEIFSTLVEEKKTDVSKMRSSAARQKAK